MCGTGDVERNAARRFDVDGHRLCVVRIEDQDSGSGSGSDAWYVIGDRCSHAEFSLAAGDVWVDEREIECLKHGSTFSLATGEPQSLPATKPVPVYEVRVDGTDVWVRLPEEGGS